MATITVENVPNNIIKKYGNKVMFSYDLFSEENYDIDFKELSKSEITPEILKSIEKSKKTPKANFNCLSKEYVNI
jgi:hypothetical protein